MLSGRVDMRGLDNLRRKVAAIADLTDRRNVRPLLDELGRTIVEDNRAGVLSGLDKDDKPMRPLRYRKGRSKPTAYRAPSQFGIGRRTLRNDNLTTAEYRKLTGPRLAPRRAESRVIRNLKLQVPTLHRKPTGAEWIVSAAWIDIKTPEGADLLRYHFDPSNPALFYDLRGVRPRGMRKARELAIRFMRAIISRRLKGA